MKSLSIKVPLEIEKDRQKVIQAAEILAVRQPRALEVFWSLVDADLDIRLTAEDNDIEHFFHDFGLHYPIARCEESPQFRPASLKPLWLKELKPAHTYYFDVEATHAHAFANFDLGRAGSLMTVIVNAMQKASFAWLQIEFYERNLTAYFNALSSKMNSYYQVIETPITKVRNIRDAQGRARYERYTVDHKEKNKEFHTNYRRLAAHLHQKAAGKHVVCVVRGLTQPQVNLSGTKSINDISMPFGTLTASDSSLGEHLSTYYYHDPRILNDLVSRGVIEADKPLNEYVNSYVHPHRQRTNLPFLILSPSELSLFVHLPDPAKLSSVKSTRGAKIPEPALPPREGVVISQ